MGRRRLMRWGDFDALQYPVCANKHARKSSRSLSVRIQCCFLQDCEVLVFDEEANALAQEYVVRGVFPERHVDDANHVAVAVANGIGYFCSWNFKHLVRVNIRREVNLINAMTGYGPIEIIAPPEL